MPRRPPEIIPDIPLYLIPHILAREFRKHGDEVEGLTITATHRHFYNISIRTRRVPKELRGDNGSPDQV
jgi:hypothetical protein